MDGKELQHQRDVVLGGVSSAALDVLIFIATLGAGEPGISGIRSGPGPVARDLGDLFVRSSVQGGRYAIRKRTDLGLAVRFVEAFPQLMLSMCPLLVNGLSRLGWGRVLR